MRILLNNLILIGFLSLLSCNSEPTILPGEQEASIPKPPENGYDKALAEQLQADDYGMHQYVMAFLKAGPNRDQSPEEAEKLQRAHLDNINKLAEDGKLVLAGPFMDDGEVRGIYVFDVKTIQEAEELTQTDPAIQAGRLTMELHPWYGSAALMQVNEVHKKITKTDI